MATEEDASTMAAAEADPKPAATPSYPEVRTAFPSPLPSPSCEVKLTALRARAQMILAAIEALDDRNGSNKTAISQHIEGKYEGLLPPAHPSLLTAHLARMKQTGELAFSKNNYFRGDDPSLPPKRGRGRPPKPKDAAAAAPAPAPAAPAASSPRPRGRPPKPKDPLAEAVAKATSGMPRARGRPPKKAKVEQEDPIGAPAAASAPAAAAEAAPPVKRGRGRPPKVRPAAPVGEPAAA
uniref:HMG-Y-related protein A n=1 Tax=Oryza glumipatula TaxID=40148 RepID=A0A0E0B2Q9_9ORYZ